MDLGRSGNHRFLDSPKVGSLPLVRKTVTDKKLLMLVRELQFSRLWHRDLLR